MNDNDQNTDSDFKAAHQADIDALKAVIEKIDTAEKFNTRGNVGGALSLVIELMRDIAQDELQSNLDIQKSYTETDQDKG